MTALQPPFAVENGSHSHTAQLFRQPLAASWGSSGVLDPGDLAVTASATPDANVNVAAGVALIAGTTSALQGTYLGRNDGSVVVPIAANASGNPRVDLVVARVRDSQYDGGGDDDWVITTVQGTPAPSPSAPATPASAVSLATVAVANGFSAITSADITDTRVRAMSRQASAWTHVSSGGTALTGYTTSSGSGSSWASLTVPSYPFPTLQAVTAQVQCFAYTPTKTQCHVRVWRGASSSGVAVAGPWMTNTSTENGVTVAATAAHEWVDAGTSVTYYGRVLVNAGGSAQIFVDSSRNVLRALVMPA